MKLKCKCGYEWDYHSRTKQKKALATCPSCCRRVKTPHYFEIKKKLENE